MNRFARSMWTTRGGQRRYRDMKKADIQKLLLLALCLAALPGLTAFFARAAQTSAGPQTVPDPVALNREDGEYSIEVNMTGGGGRAAISSPTLLIVREGKAYARLLWSSADYDYMTVGGVTYYNLSENGGSSAFEIPITALDEGIPVIADTTAMGDPLEIRYTLIFYEETIGPKGRIPQEAAKSVLLIAAAIILLGGVLNWLVRKRRK